MNVQPYFKFRRLLALSNYLGPLGHPQIRLAMETELLELYRSLDRERRLRNHAEEWSRRPEWDQLRNLAKLDPITNPTKDSASVRSIAEREFQRRLKQRLVARTSYHHRKQKLLEEWKHIAQDAPLDNWKHDPTSLKANGKVAPQPISASTLRNSTTAKPKAPGRSEVPKKGKAVTVAEMVNVTNVTTAPRRHIPVAIHETETVSDTGEGEQVGVPPPIWELTVPKASAAIIAIADGGEGTRRWRESLRMFHRHLPFASFFACAAPLQLTGDDAGTSPTARQWTSLIAQQTPLTVQQTSLTFQQTSLTVQQTPLTATPAELQPLDESLRQLDVASLPVLLLVQRLLMGGIPPERIVLLARGQGALVAFRVAFVLLEQPLLGIVLLHSQLGPLLSSQVLPPPRSQVNLVQLSAGEDSSTASLIASEAKKLKSEHWLVTHQSIPATPDSPSLMRNAFDWIIQNMPEHFEARASTTKWL